MEDTPKRPIVRTLTVKEIQQIGKYEATLYYYVERMKTASFEEFLKFVEHKDKLTDMMNVNAAKLMAVCYSLSPEEIDKLGPDYFTMWQELNESSLTRKNSTLPSTTASPGESGTALI